jgi:hypothetical protein
MTPEILHITCVIFQEGHFQGREDMRTPSTMIDRSEEDVVFLNGGKRILDRLPDIPAHSNGGCGAEKREVWSV